MQKLNLYPHFTFKQWYQRVSSFKNSKGTSIFTKILALLTKNRQKDHI